MPLSLGAKNASQGTNESVKTESGIIRQVKTFDLTYYVCSDAVGDDIADVRTAAGIPTFGTTIDGCYCDSIRGKVVDRVYHPVAGTPAELWEITCSFTNQYDTSRDSSDPINQQPRVRWYCELENYVLDEEARTGLPIVTANDERILIEGTMPIPVLEITRNEFAPADPNLIMAYANKVNSTPFWGVPKGSALMMSPTTEEFDHDNELYIKTVYTIKFRFLRDEEGDIKEDGWAARPLHEGTLVRKVIGGAITQAKDDNGNPRTVNLDSDGVKLADGVDPVTLLFYRHDEIDFNNLSLGPWAQ